jgi:hypothetical protein
MEFCHRVSLKLAHLVEREQELGLEIMRRLKRTIDPLGIMNPVSKHCRIINASHKYYRVNSAETDLGGMQ